MSSSVKAGLIGAGAAVILSLLSLIPCVGCIALILGLLLYAGVGVLAAYWMPPPRTAGAGAGAGAIAALITALVDGVVSMIITAIRFAITGGAEVMSQLPPEALQQLEQMDVEIPPAVFTIGGALGVSAICCVGGLVLAAGLGAAGGAIMAASKPE